MKKKIVILKIPKNYKWVKADKVDKRNLVKLTFIKVCQK
jgi:hypothetical protein